MQTLGNTGNVKISGYPNGKQKPKLSLQPGGRDMFLLPSGSYQGCCSGVVVPSTLHAWRSGMQGAASGINPWPGQALRFLSQQLSGTPWSLSTLGCQHCPSTARTAAPIQPSVASGAHGSHSHHRDTACEQGPVPDPGSPLQLRPVLSRAWGLQGIP